MIDSIRGTLKLCGFTIIKRLVYMHAYMHVLITGTYCMLYTDTDCQIWLALEMKRVHHGQ